MKKGEYQWTRSEMSAQNEDCHLLEDIYTIAFVFFLFSIIKNARAISSSFLPFVPVFSFHPYFPPIPVCFPHFYQCVYVE